MYLPPTFLTDLPISCHFLQLHYWGPYNVCPPQQKLVGPWTRPRSIDADGGGSSNRCASGGVTDGGTARVTTDHQHGAVNSH